MEGCVLFFCKSLRRVELLETREPGFIRTVTLPEQSDFRYAVSQWDLEPRGDGTLLTYHLEMEPDFWHIRWPSAPFISTSMKSQTRAGKRV